MMANLSASRPDSRMPVSPSARTQVCSSGAQLVSRPSVPTGLRAQELDRRTALRSVSCRATSSPPVQARGGEELKAMRLLEGAVDDASLHNPLQRMHRLGTGWFGVIFEYEGVIVEDAHENHTKAWLELMEKEGRPRPAQWALKRAEGMKNEQVVSEVLCLARIPEVVKRLAREKEAIFVRLQGERRPVCMPGVSKLLDVLETHDIPVALATSEPEVRVLDALDRIGLRHRFDTIVTGDDVQRGRPDPEPYLYAAHRMQRPPQRCVVIGNSNLSIEAAHEVGMQCVTLGTRHPLYELTASDLVLRQLELLSVQNLKQLFRMEEGVEPAQPEMQAEASAAARTAIAVLDRDDDPFL